MNNYRYYIGIDTGVNTGLAVWDAKEKKFVLVDTMMIHQAIGYIEWHLALDGIVLNKNNTFYLVEDARKRKWFGNSGKEKAQGAGSIKRDAKIWEDFLTDNGYNFEMVAPKDNTTKLDEAFFKKLTGWDKRTSKHSRDAAMLVFKK